MRVLNEYALYKGEEVLAIGTIKDIAENQGVDERTIRFYATGTYKRRLEKRKGKGRNCRWLIRITD